MEEWIFCSPFWNGLIRNFVLVFERHLVSLSCWASPSKQIQERLLHPCHRAKEAKNPSLQRRKLTWCISGLLLVYDLDGTGSSRPSRFLAQELCRYKNHIPGPVWVVQGQCETCFAAHGEESLEVSPGWVGVSNTGIKYSVGVYVML